MIQEFVFKITKGPEGILQTSPERITVGHIDDNESIRLVFERPPEFNNFDLELFLYDWTDNGRVSVGKENVFDLNRPYTARKFIYLMPSFVDDNGYKRSAGTATLWFDDVIQGGIVPLPPWPDPIAELAKSAWFGKQEIDLQTGEFIIYNLKGEEVTRFSANGGGSGGPALWGGISGNIGNQSDLQDALNEKANADDLAAHKADTAKHITETERSSWNQKADENDIKGVADNLALHQENAVKHITAAERADWNAKANQTDLAAEESARISADADKADIDFVNSSIQAIAANYVTPNEYGDSAFTSFEALNMGPWFYRGLAYTPTKADYAIFNNQKDQVCRAGFDGVQWNFQYIVNDTPFTNAQLRAINSGITSTLVGQIEVNRQSIMSIDTMISELKSITDIIKDSTILCI